MQLTSSEVLNSVGSPRRQGDPLLALRAGAVFRFLGMEAAHAIALLLIGLALTGWSAVVSGTVNAGGIAFALLYPLASYYLGRLILAAVDIEPLIKRSFAALFLLGYLALGLIQFAAHSCLPGSLEVQFAVIVPIVLLGQFLLPVEDRGVPSADAWTTVYVSAFCLLAATCWARGLLQSIHADGAEVVFCNWMDFFVHASFIARFTAAPGLWGMGNAELAGLPASFYHYASYLAPATQTLFTGQSALDAARGCWVPLGTFLTGLAAYVIVLPWAGRAGGVCAAVALLTLPDPSFYWPSNGFLGYHWLQQVGGAGMYGTACAALALTLLLSWRRRRSRSALVLALSLTTATLLYKAQIFVVFVPLFGACLSLYWPGASRGRRGVLFIAWLALCFLGAWLLNRLHPQDPPFALNPPYFKEYCHALAVNFPEGACRRLLEGGFAEWGRSRYYAAALGVCAVASFGVWLGVGACLLAVALFRRHISVTDAAPWLALMLYLALMAGLNDYALVGHNKWELTHRPVVWVYFLLCTWCAGRAGRWLTEPRASASGKANRSLMVAALMMLMALLLLLPLRMGRYVQEGKSIWRFQCANLRVPSGLVDCARFLARAGQATDVIQDGHCDDKLIVGALAEKRSYLARPDDWQRDKSPRVREEVSKRRACLENLLKRTSDAELRQAARASGIRWLLLHPDDAVAWQREILQAPVFVSQGYRVFDLAP